MESSVALRFAAKCLEEGSWPSVVLDDCIRAAAALADIETALALAPDAAKAAWPFLARLGEAVASVEADGQKTWPDILALAAHFPGAVQGLDRARHVGLDILSALAELASVGTEGPLPTPEGLEKLARTASVLSGGRALKALDRDDFALLDAWWAAVLPLAHLPPPILAAVAGQALSESGAFGAIGPRVARMVVPIILKKTGFTKGLTGYVSKGCRGMFAATPSSPLPWIGALATAAADDRRRLRRLVNLVDAPGRLIRRLSPGRGTARIWPWVLANPVFMVSGPAAAFGITPRAGRKTVKRLETAGLVEKVSGGPWKIYAVRGLFG